MSILKLTATSRMKNEREFGGTVDIEGSISVKTTSYLLGVDEDILIDFINQDDLQTTENNKLLDLNQFPKLLISLSRLENLNSNLKLQLKELDINDKNFTITLDDGSTITYSS